MKTKKITTWKIVTSQFKKEYGYKIHEHPSYNLIKFLVKCIDKERKK